MVKKITDYYEIHTISNEIFLNKKLDFFCVIEFYPKAEPRGNHVHKEKIEHLLVLDGSLEANLWFPQTNQKIKFEIKKNELIIIKPGIAHGFSTTTDKTIALEFSEHKILTDDNEYLDNPFVV